MFAADQQDYAEEIATALAAYGHEIVRTNLEDGEASFHAIDPNVTFRILLVSQSFLDEQFIKKASDKLGERRRAAENMILVASNLSRETITTFSRSLWNLPFVETTSATIVATRIQQTMKSYAKPEFFAVEIPREPNPSTSEEPLAATSLEHDPVWQMAVRYQFYYSIAGLLLGLVCAVLGVVLFVMEVSGATTWTATVLGLESKLVDAAPGSLFVVVGLAIVHASRFSVKASKYTKNG